MAREIKFRAWDTVNKKMLQPLSGILWKQPVIPANYVEGLFDFQIPNNYGHLFDSDMMTVSKCEIMQFTGLKDKHGNEVYEGDIVKGYTNEFGVHNTHIAKVHYDEYHLLQPFHHVWDYDANFWVDCVVSGFEIVGNIYEHSELLEPKA